MFSMALFVLVDVILLWVPEKDGFPHNKNSPRALKLVLIFIEFCNGLVPLGPVSSIYWSYLLD